MAFYNKEGMQAKGIWKQDPEAITWAQEGGGWELEKASQWHLNEYHEVNIGAASRGHNELIGDFKIMTGDVISIGLTMKPTKFGHYD